MSNTTFTNEPGKSLIGTVSSTGSQSPDRVLLYAPPGWGKDTLAAGWPDPIMLWTSGEDRIKKLIAANLVRPIAYREDVIGNWECLTIVLRALLQEPHSYKTVILNTIGGIERLGQELVCQDSFHNDWSGQGFNRFGEGDRIVASKLIGPLLNLLDDLREQRGMRVVLLGHAQVKTVKRPDMPDYERFEPTLNKRSWDLICKWADMILFGTTMPRLSKDPGKERDKLAKIKASEGEDRILFTSHSATHEAKNCHRLPVSINLGNDPSTMFRRFAAAFPKEKPCTSTPSPSPVALGVIPKIAPLKQHASPPPPSVSPTGKSPPPANGSTTHAG